MKKYAYIEAPYGICAEIGLLLEDVRKIATSGENDISVSRTLARPYVWKQFKGFSDEQLRKTAEYLCDAPKIETRQDAIEYILWSAAWDIADEMA